MPPTLATALALGSFGLLLLLSVLLSRASDRLGAPIALIFLAIGVGARGVLGDTGADDAAFAARIGTAALILIIWDGGLNTPLRSIRSVLAPAGMLATGGVLLTAALVAGAGRLLGLAWLPAMLIGAIVSSTDAASVFAVLRGRRIHLRRRLALTLEVESGLNDPAAVLLTATLTAAAAGAGLGALALGDVLGGIARELTIGAAVGVALGRASTFLLPRLRLPAAGLYPVLTLALALLGYGLSTILGGSGLLTVYLQAVLVGNGALPFRQNVTRVHDALAWLSQITMFLVLGVLVDMADVVAAAPIGIGLALLLTFVARPVAVALCLLPFRYPLREMAFVGWVGLRGAVPIVLALGPVLAGIPGADRIFAIVFCLVAANTVLPGMTVGWLTARLKLARPVTPPPAAVMEIAARQPLENELLSFHLPADHRVVHARVEDLAFPPGAAPVLIVRQRHLMPATPATQLHAGDHLYIVCAPRARGPVVRLLGQPEAA